MTGAHAQRKPYTAPSYFPHWTVLFLILFGFGAYRWVADRQDFPVLSPKNTVARDTSSWYMILRMPEVPSSTTDVDSYQRAFTSRIQGLLREGFHPILLSDVYRHWSRGEGLPSRAVVILFDPGYRRTFEILGPVLSELKVPAVWLTDSEVLRQSDRRYISNHTSRLMTNSTQWDLGLYKGNDVYIRNHVMGQWKLPAARAQLWSPLLGTSAFNPGDAKEKLSRLNVNSTWTNEEFTDRILAEVPVRSPVLLSGRLIGNHLWGIAVPASGRFNGKFDLESLLEKRGATVSWLGTRGVHDFALNMNCEGVSGELWLLLRSDDEVGDSVRVGLGEGAAFIEQEVHHNRKRLAIARASETAGPGRHFALDIRLTGSHLTVGLDGRTIMNVDNLSEEVSSQGLARLTVYDKLRGTAIARGITIHFTPLTDEEHSSPP